MRTPLFFTPREVRCRIIASGLLMARRRKQWVLLALATLALIALLPPMFHLVKTAYRDRGVLAKLPAGYADDVSRLNKTQVAEIWDMPSDAEKAETRLRELL